MKEKPITNKEVAHLLRSIEAAYLIKNVNRFRMIAYQNAADTVERMTREIKDVWQEGGLDSIPGIGTTIASALDEYFKKGYSSHFNQALKGIPPTVFELMKVPSIGPKKAYKLITEFKLNNGKTLFKDLRKLCQQNKIAALPTFGKKSQDLILRAIDLFAKKTKIADRMPLPYADALAKEVMVYLKKNPFIKDIDALGSLRRMVATIGDVDIAVSVAKPQDIPKIIGHFLKFPRKISVDNAGGKKASIIISPNIRCDLRVTEKKNYGPMLQYFTGGKTHNILLREYALKRGLSLSEYGIKEVKTQKNHLFPTEEAFYKFLDLQYIPAELREGTNEIDLAKQNKVPKLVELKDIKGDLHTHSSYQMPIAHDLGANSYLEIVAKAKSLGYQYIGFSDHNLKVSDLTKAQVIKVLRKRKSDIEKQIKNFAYFVGLEVDILPNGQLAIPKEGVEFLDYMIVSIHSVFSMEKKAMTQRVLEALDNPKVKILAHPTGRLLNKREGYELEWPKIFEYCSKKNIAIEINAWPERLDLVDTLVREALAYKVKFVINTDAHATFQMDNMPYGVAVARRGWATKNDIMNTLPAAEFSRWIRG